MKTKSQNVLKGPRTRPFFLEGRRHRARPPRPPRPAVRSIYRAVHAHRRNLLGEVHTFAKQHAPLCRLTAAHTRRCACMQSCTGARMIYLWPTYIYTSVHTDIKYTHSPRARTHSRVSTQMLSSDNCSPGGSLGHYVLFFFFFITSLHLPLCNNQALKYHQTNRGQGICAASPGRRRATASPAPSSLSSSYASPPPDLLGTEQREPSSGKGRMMKGEGEGTERRQSQ